MSDLWDVPSGLGGGADQSAGYSPIWGDQWDTGQTQSWWGRSWDKLTDPATAGTLSKGLQGLQGLSAGGGGGMAQPPAGGASLQRGNAAGLANLIQQLRQRQTAQRKALGLPEFPAGGLLGGV